MWHSTEPRLISFNHPRASLFTTLHVRPTSHHICTSIELAPVATSILESRSSWIECLHLERHQASTNSLSPSDPQLFITSPSHTIVPKEIIACRSTCPPNIPRAHDHAIGQVGIVRAPKKGDQAWQTYGHRLPLSMSGKPARRSFVQTRSKVWSVGLQQTYRSVSIPHTWRRLVLDKEYGLQEYLSLN